MLFCSFDHADVSARQCGNEKVLESIGNSAFCIDLHLTGVHLGGELQHVGDVSEQKINVDQSKLDKYVVSCCQRNCMEVWNVIKRTQALTKMDVGKLQTRVAR